MRKLSLRIFFIIALPVLLLCGCNAPGTGGDVLPTSADTPEKIYMDYLPGTIVRYGSYEQDNDTGNGAEPIEWVVLANEGSRVLLITCDVIELQKMHSNFNTVSWKDTSLRKWLNSTFINAAFSADEQSIIQETETMNGITDKVFILSNSEIDEIEKYIAFNKDLLRPKASKRVLAKAHPNSLFIDINKERSSWWTRTSAGTASYCYVSMQGEICRQAQLAQNQEIGIRPALWVESVYPQLEKAG